jgi:hypothetical protein
MNILLGDLVFVSVSTEQHGITGVQGIVTAVGYIEDKPDEFWFEIAGLTCRLYTDDEGVSITK